jgi:hypothetical protein
MAYTFNKDLITTGTNSIPIIYQLKEMLKTAGWTIMSSSDGVTNLNTTPGNANDVILNSNSGVNGLNNVNAWFRIQMPLVGGVNRELLFIRNLVNSFIIKYSYSSGFVNSPGLTSPPTATDSVEVYSGFLQSSDLSFCIIVGGAVENYNFMLWGADNAQNTKTFFALDKLSSNISGDADPYVFWVHAPSSNFVASVISSSTSPVIKTWFAKGTISQSWTGVQCYQYNSSTGKANTINGVGFGVNSITGQTDILPCILGRNASLPNPRGLKGVSSMVKWMCSSASFGELFTISSFGDHICIGDCVIPWDGTIKNIYS